MNTKLFFLAATLCITGFAQTGINYKALIKDASGNVLNGKDIEIVFTIEIDEAAVYSETQDIKTDSNGIAIAVIGKGTVITGEFETIDWKTRDAQLNVQIDSGNGLKDLGNSLFNAVPYAIRALNVEGLEAIDEGKGIGWRLAGSNPNYYGNIGFAATNLSYSDFDSETSGATGTNSATMGVRTTASGDSSLALGSDSTASDDFAMAIGAGSTASGGGAMAIGNSNEASGNNASAFGNNTEASGLNATAMGRYTIAGSAYSMAVGRYNVGEGNATQWQDLDPLFEIGNGSSDTNRGNALTILKNGQHTINSQGAGLVIRNAINAIVISDSQANSIDISDAGFHGIRISDAAANGIIISNAQQSGITASAVNRGGSFSGGEVGVYATASNHENPDIILGGVSGNSTDNGIISSNPTLPGSDVYLRSNDAVVIELDYDNNNNGRFIIKDSDNNDVFEVNESGNVNLDGRLRIEDINIEKTVINSFDFLMVDAGLLPGEDAEHLLGSESNRWINLWAVDGTINTSDRREKRNIKDLSYGLNEVLQMQPVSFNWINKNNQDLKLGLIAQDLQVLIPEVVISHSWDKDRVTGALIKKKLDRLGVYYSDLIPVLVKAIQEQQQLIEALNTKNSNQKSQLNAVEQNYQALLSRVEYLETNTSN